METKDFCKTRVAQIKLWVDRDLDDLSSPAGSPTMRPVDISPAFNGNGTFLRPLSRSDHPPGNGLPDLSISSRSALAPVRHDGKEILPMATGRTGISGHGDATVATLYELRARGWGRILITG